MKLQSLIHESIETSYDVRLKALAISMNTIQDNPDFETEYLEGVFSASFYRESDAENFVQLALNTDYVDDYDIEYLEFENMVGVYEVYIYINPDLVLYEPTDVYVDDEGNYYDTEYDEGDYIPESVNEVRRRIKVNAKGRRRIKMQCNKGFKWDATARVCRKISGAALATKRKAIRQMVRTKKSMGSALRMRVKRKTAKARRFRRGMGLKR